MGWGEGDVDELGEGDAIVVLCCCEIMLFSLGLSTCAV